MSGVTGFAGVLIWTSAARFPAMLRFYRDVLGLTPRHVKPGMVNFAWGDVRLSVAIHGEIDGPNRDPLRTMVNLAVDDIAAEHARLAALGVPFLRPPEREDWGGSVATLTDPDGNLLQLFQM